MLSQKQSKKLSKKEEPLFTEEERNTIPFVRTVSNKIRNINKKLIDIRELQAKGEDSLKPEQKEKLSKKEGLLEEITKYEDVLKLYKTIENERKEGETSEAQRTINYIFVTRELHRHGDDLVAKGVLTADELKTIKSEAGRHPRTVKEEITQIKNQIKEFFTSETTVNLIERIATNKQFLNLKLHQNEAERKTSHQEKSLASEKIDQKTKQVHPKKQQVVVQIAKVVKVEAAPVITEVVGSQNSQPSQKSAPVHETKGETSQKADESAEQVKSSEAPVEKKEVTSVLKNQPGRGNYRSRGAEQWPSSAHDDGKYSKEQKDKLAEDGFIVVNQKKTVKSKHSTKQFGPRSDNRQYHQ